METQVNISDLLNEENDTQIKINLSKLDEASNNDSEEEDESPNVAQNNYQRCNAFPLLIENNQDDF